MPQYNLNELERRPDWQLLVTSVPCPICRAIVGAPCSARRINEYEMPNGAETRQFNPSYLPRVDYHAERKYAAAEAWYRQPDAGQQDSDRKQDL